MIGDRAKEYLSGVRWMNCQADALRDLEALQAALETSKEDASKNMEDYNEEIGKAEARYVESLAAVTEAEKVVLSAVKDRERWNADKAVLLEALELLSKGFWNQFRNPGDEVNRIAREAIAKVKP